MIKKLGLETNLLIRMHYKRRIKTNVFYVSMKLWNSFNWSGFDLFGAQLYEYILIGSKNATKTSVKALKMQLSWDNITYALMGSKLGHLLHDI
jgi:hypothetical protein